MSLNQVVKIPSEQSAFDSSGSKNNVDFILPAGQVYDLSKSYISVSLDLKYFDASVAEQISKGVIHMGDNVDGDGGDITKCVYIPSSASLVSNCHLSSQNKGKISDVRKAGKFAFVKSHYKQSSEDFRNDIGKLNPFCKEQNTTIGTSLECNTYGDDTSRFRTHDIKIHLKDLMPYCNISAHDGNRHGNTSLHTEIKFDQLTNSQVTLSNTIKVPRHAGNNAAVAGTVGIAAFNGFTTAAANPDLKIKLVSTGKYANKNMQPFYVGSTVKVAGQAAGTAFENTTTVEAITQGADDSVIVTIATPIQTTAGGAIPDATAITALFITDPGTTTSTLTINNVELVTEIVSESGNSEVTYTTMLSEEDTYSAVSQLNRNYDIPPMCKNIYIMFFKEGGLVSDDDILNYRLAIDDVVQSRTNIVVGSGEHYDNITRAMANNGEVIANMCEKYFAVAANAAGNRQGKGRNFMIAQPVPFLNRSQKLQVEFNADPGQTLNGRHIIYYDVVKVV